MNKYIVFIISSFIISVILVAVVTILSTKGTTYSRGLDEPELNQLSYAEAMKEIRSRSHPMTITEAVELNITNRYFWTHVLLVSLLVVFVSSISFSIAEKWERRNAI